MRVGSGTAGSSPSRESESGAWAACFSMLGSVGWAAGSEQIGKQNSLRIGWVVRVPRPTTRKVQNKFTFTTRTTRSGIRYRALWVWVQVFRFQASGSSFMY